MRICCLWVLVVSSLAVNAQSFSGNTWSEVKANKAGTVIFDYVETPVFAYLNSSGKLSGICIDIMNDFVNYVNRMENVKLDVKWIGEGNDFQGMYDKVKISRGGVFGLGNITITEERKKEVRFSPPFINNFSVLITNKNIPMIMRFGDLSKLFTRINAYTVRGTINDTRIANIQHNYFPGVRIVFTDSSDEMIDKVVIDDNGIAFVDVALYLHAIKTSRPIRRHPVGDQAVEKFGIAMPVNSDWQEIMDKFFMSEGGYTKSARYRNILGRHFGETGVSLLLQGGHQN